MMTAYIIGKEQFLANLRDAPNNVRRSLLKEMNRIVTYLVRTVKSNKLSGDPLHVRTGVLRNSIAGEVTDNGQLIEGTVGTNVSYAAVHEYGFQGTVWVPEYTRRSAYVRLKNLETIRVKLNSRRKGKIIGTGVVNAHAMKMNMPERSFLRSTLNEELPTIRESLEIAIAEGLQASLKP